MPEVSVILPNYNHAKYLPARIDSILGQRFQDFELIILDDCSTDNSRDVIENYRKDPHVSHIIYNSANSGSAFKQWNKGVELATGKYIWIAESDDTAMPDFLVRLVPLMEDDQILSLAYSQSNDINDKGEVTGSRIVWTDTFSPNIWHRDFCMDGNEFIKTYLAFKNVIPNASAVLFRKDIFIERREDLFTTMKLTGDWLVWVTLLMNQRITFIAEPLNNFRSHADTTRIHDTRDKKLRRILEEIPVIDKISNLQHSAALRVVLVQATLTRWCRQFPFPGDAFKKEFYSICSPLRVAAHTLLRHWLLFQSKRIYGVIKKSAIK